MSLTASKNNIIREMLVRSADDNYITARWCMANGQYLDFLWLGLHAIEKYLKAVLLINGRAARGYNHDIVKLYEAVSAFAGDLLPTMLERPEGLSIHVWRDQRPRDFLEYLLINGNAENRYLIYGYVISGEALHKLDAMVFAIRRLVCQLDERYIPESQGRHAPTFTHRDRLRDHPEQYERMGMPLDEMIASNEDTQKRSAALNLNMSFAPAGFEHGSLPGGSAGRNPVLVRRVLEPLNRDNPEAVDEALELVDWFLSNVQVSKDVEKQLKQAANEARSRLAKN